MPDVWEILKSNSSLDFGDAWEHLLNQQGGTGIKINSIYNEIDVELLDDFFDILLQEKDLEMDYQTDEYEVKEISEIKEIDILIDEIEINILLDETFLN